MMQICARLSGRGQPDEVAVLPLHGRLGGALRFMLQDSILVTMIVRVIAQFSPADLPNMGRVPMSERTSLGSSSRGLSEHLDFLIRTLQVFGKPAQEKLSYPCVTTRTFSAVPYSPAYRSAIPHKIKRRCCCKHFHHDFH